MTLAAVKSGGAHLLRKLGGGALIRRPPRTRGQKACRAQAKRLAL